MEGRNEGRKKGWTKVGRKKGDEGKEGKEARKKAKKEGKKRKDEDRKEGIQ